MNSMDKKKNLKRAKYLYGIAIKDYKCFAENKNKNEIDISKDRLYSYYYALNILKGPFKLGEDLISTDAQTSFHYFLFATRERFELGEYAMSTLPTYFLYYCKNIKNDNTSLYYKFI